MKTVDFIIKKYKNEFDKKIIFSIIIQKFKGCF